MKAKYFSYTNLAITSTLPAISKSPPRIYAFILCSNPRR